MYSEYNDFVKVNRDSMTGVDLACAICCEEYTDDTMICQMPCNLKHIFHPDCIDKWLSNHLECPICKF